MNILNQLEKDSAIIMNLLNPKVAVEEEVTEPEAHWTCGKVNCDCDESYQELVDNELAFN